METSGRVKGIALLWFDDSKIPLADKIRRAAAAYEVKYGRKATRCRVNLSTVGLKADVPEKVDDIKIVIDGRVLKNHFWMGPE